MTALFPGAQEGRAGQSTPVLARPGRLRWLWPLLLLPGGCLIALGLGIAWAGLVLCLPGLRRMTAVMGGPDAKRVAPEQLDGTAHEPSPYAGEETTPDRGLAGGCRDAGCVPARPRPLGEPHESSPRGGARCTGPLESGEAGARQSSATTASVSGEPAPPPPYPWLAPLSREVH